MIFNTHCRFDDMRASVEERKVRAAITTEEETDDDNEASIVRQICDEQRQKMREMAKKLSRKISKAVEEREKNDNNQVI